ncbi:MAG: 2-hydroxyacyl-CoA dehydratase family protein, partial [Dehalococcoidia bacterium]
GMWEAKETGELLIMGVGFISSLPAGFGDYRTFGLGPNFGRIMSDPEQATRVLEAAEAKGYDLDTCPTLRSSLGALFLGMFDISRTGERLVPELLLENRTCQPQGKFAQLWQEYYGVPTFILDFPPSIDHRQYLVDQMNDAIEWMEKVTGRTYDDEKFATAVENEWESRVLWARMCMHQKAIPAPLDQLMLFSFEDAFWRGRHQQEAVELMRMACDEVAYRAANGIAALASERCRLLHEGVATWFKSQVLRYPRRYGAVYIGSQQIFGDWGAYEMAEDGTLTPISTLKEMGRSLNSRQEALQAVADVFLAYCGQTMCADMEKRIKIRLAIARDWKVDGVVFSMERGCKGTISTHMETAWQLKEQGIPCMPYDNSSCNPKEFNEGEYMTRFDAFMESLGLKPLEA